MLLRRARPPGQLVSPSDELPLESAALVLFAQRGTVPQGKVTSVARQGVACIDVISAVSLFLMYSMPCASAVRRLEQALGKLRDERFETGAEELTVSFSAGVAECPRDGTDWASIYRVADDTLARAKQEGRNRVLPASI